VQCGVHGAPLGPQLLLDLQGMFRVGNVELQDLRLIGQFPGGAFGESQTATGTGEHNFGPLFLCHLCHAEGQRRISQHAGDQDPFTIENSHRDATVACGR